ncbi:PQQ-binding-like beta-propeller repeat protein [Micromonospora sp. NPDC050397]|uniref:outer membrane protein assembly factor BamB family protein n=1 Tax=Micromonospora sp. NPDC050397 TaxID=3364279 RepID=UPI00384D94CD
MIDLDAIGDEDEAPPRPPLTWLRLRPAALALVTALLLTTGGSALPPPPTLVEIATLTYAPGAPASNYPESWLVLTEDRLVTSVIQPDGASWLVSAYELDRGGRVWTYVHPGKPNTAMRLQHQAGLVLVSGIRTGDTGGPTTVALDARSGRERWSLPHEIRALRSGDTAIAVDSIHPAGSELPDGELPPDTSAYGSPWGQLYSEPPSGYVASGVDLSTGELRWRSDLLDHVTAARDGRFDALATTGGDGAATGLVVVTREAGVELLDLLTGAVRHRFPAPHPELHPQLDDDLLLVAHTATEMTAYSTEDHRPRWTRPMVTDGSFVFCYDTGLICEATPTGNWVVDPATGGRRWPVRPGHDLYAVAGHLVEMISNTPARPLRTVDPRTGDILVNLINWTGAMLGPDGPLLLTDAKGFLGPTWLGVLDPGAAAPVRLGEVTEGISDCRIGTSVIACVTVEHEVRIWRYRTTARPGDD